MQIYPCSLNRNQSFDLVTIQSKGLDKFQKEEPVDYGVNGINFMPFVGRDVSESRSSSHVRSVDVSSILNVDVDANEEEEDSDNDDTDWDWMHATEDFSIPGS